MNTHRIQPYYNWYCSWDAKVTVQQTSELLMHTESEISWTSVNTKHAIEETTSNAWHSWRQVFTVNSITRYNDTGALQLTSWVWWVAIKVVWCTEVSHVRGLFVTRHILSQANITVILKCLRKSMASQALVCVHIWAFCRIHWDKCLIISIFCLTELLYWNHVYGAHECTLSIDTT